MVARGEPLSDQLRLSHALGLGVKGAILVDFDAHCSIVRHEPPFGWIFKGKGVFESQDADIKMLLRGGRTKRSSFGINRPLKSR